MDWLIKEYEIALRQVNKAKMKATNEEDRSLLASLIGYDLSKDKRTINIFNGEKEYMYKFINYDNYCILEVI